MFTLSVYAPLTTSNVDVYAPQSTGVCREQRHRGLLSLEEEEGVYADYFPERPVVYARAACGYVYRYARCLRYCLRKHGALTRLINLSYTM